MDISVRNRNNLTPLYHAAMMNDCNFVKYLVDECQAGINAENSEENTPLQYAAWWYATDVVKFFFREKK
jgi:ankyrin repeat protein